MPLKDIITLSSASTIILGVLVALIAWAASAENLVVYSAALVLLAVSILGGQIEFYRRRR